MSQQEQAAEEQKELLADIAAAYNNRQRPRRGVSAKEECDAFRMKYADAMAKVSISLAKTNGEIQQLLDPDDLCKVMKNGFLEAVGFMCATLDYANNIQMLSKMTKLLKKENEEP